MMPPSPLLSARITNTMYLTTTAMVSAQKTSDRTPRTFSNSGVTPWVGLKHSLIVYSGDVPRSPYTTPRAPSESASRSRVEEILGAAPVCSAAESERSSVEDPMVYATGHQE